MFGIILSAINAALAFFVKQAVIKGVVLMVLFAITSTFIPMLISILPNSIGLQQSFNFVTPQMWYWLEPFQIGTGLSIVLNAYALRFIIRRIPVIG